MKNVKMNVIVGAIILTVICLSAIGATADPVVSNLSTYPAEPEPLSTVKVTVTVTGENILSVNMTVSECSDNPNQCYLAHTNIPMTLTANGNYEANVTLTDDEGRADHMQFQFVINDNGTEYTLTKGENGEWKVYFATDDGDNTQVTNGKDNSSPGFDLIFIMIAIFVGVALYKKRDRR